MIDKEIGDRLGRDIIALCNLFKKTLIDSGSDPREIDEHVLHILSGSLASVAARALMPSEKEDWLKHIKSSLRQELEDRSGKWD